MDKLERIAKIILTFMGISEYQIVGPFEQAWEEAPDLLGMGLYRIMRRGPFKWNLQQNTRNGWVDIYDKYVNESFKVLVRSIHECRKS
jgi:hypothetical protein